jgi:hypothetical protein
VAQWRNTSRAYLQHPAAQGRTAPTACRPSARLLAGMSEQPDTPTTSRDLANAHVLSATVPQCLAVQLSGEGKGPHHRHELNNARNSEAPGADRRQPAAIWSDCPVLQDQPARITVIRWGIRQNNWLTALASANDLAHTAPTRHGRLEPNPSKMGISGHRPHDCGSPERVFARGLPHSRIFIGRNGVRASAALARPAMAWISKSLRNRPGGVGVGATSDAHGYIDLLSIFRGPVQKTCCRGATVDLLKFGGAASGNLGGWPAIPRACASHRRVCGGIAAPFPHGIRKNAPASPARAARTQP